VNAGANGSGHGATGPRNGTNGGARTGDGRNGDASRPRHAVTDHG
jgi:hypothetical protein